MSMVYLCLCMFSGMHSIVMGFSIIYVKFSLFFFSCFVSLLYRGNPCVVGFLVIIFWFFLGLLFVNLTKTTCMVGGETKKR